MKYSLLYDPNIRVEISELIKKSFVILGKEIAVLLAQNELGYKDNPKVLSEITAVNNKIADEMDKVLAQHLEFILERIK